MQKVQAVVCCPRILNSRAPAISWGYSPYLLKNSCGVQSTTEKIEKSTARAEPLPQPTAGKGWVGWASQKAKFTRVSLRNNHKVAAPLQPLFGKVSSRNVVFPNLAFSESPTHSVDSIAFNTTLPSHFKITRSSNLMGIFPLSFEKILVECKVRPRK